MQKFTVFSILLSVSVLIGIGDILFHNYLNQTGSEPLPDIEEELLPVEEPVLEEDAVEEVEEVEEVPVEGEPDVDLSGESILQPGLTLELFEAAGFTSPVLKDTIFSGLVFQFISFSAQENEADIYQWNLFDGEQYIGSIYEIRYGTEIGSFQGYLALRERASNLIDLGGVNEVNNYGDASFYFNHKTKVKTVHLIFRSGDAVYGFEYSQSYHEKMKNAFDRIGALL